VHRTRSIALNPPKSFLYLGRLTCDKGGDAIQILARAYSAYRHSTPDPWPLVIVGTGPLAAQAEGREGIILKGFVQPDDVPTLFESAGALILPSTYESWALVIHEAAAAGVPVICTAECGASVRLVQDGYSGYIVETGNSNSLQRAMSRFVRLSEERRVAMGEASYSLSLQFTPQRWAQYIQEKLAELAGQKLVAEELK
jgi:glycosyltransferase involved in cell wall biosynthesis